VGLVNLVNKIYFTGELSSRIGITLPAKIRKNLGVEHGHQIEIEFLGFQQVNHADNATENEAYLPLKYFKEPVELAVFISSRYKFNIDSQLCNEVGLNPKDILHFNLKGYTNLEDVKVSSE